MPTLVMTVPGVAMYFYLYEKIFENCQIPSVSGALARTVSVVFTSPFDMLRTYVQSKRGSRSSFQVVQKLLQFRGVGGLWIGLWPTLWRDVPFSAIYWAVYEKARQYYQSTGEKTFRSDFLAGMTGGSIAAVIATPADVLKTRLQMSIDSDTICQKEKKPVYVLPLIKELYKTEGIRGFFRGVTPRVLRIAPACALMISSYVYCKKILQEFRRTDDPI